MILSLFKKQRSNTEQKGESGSAGSNQERQIRVLMVDDEEGFARLTKRNLEAVGGFTVQTESKAQNAITMAHAFRPDIILLDVMMPDGDGGEVASRMSEDAALKDVPILFLTAAIKGSELGNRSGGRIGGRFYIAKPVPIDDLVDYIRSNVRVG